jgi:hypothetical protein
MFLELYIIKSNIFKARKAKDKSYCQYEEEIKLKSKQFMKSIKNKKDVVVLEEEKL